MSCESDELCFHRAKEERTFLASLIKKFLVVLMSVSAEGKPVYSHQRVLFMELNIIDCIFDLFIFGLRLVKKN